MFNMNLIKTLNTKIWVRCLYDSYNKFKADVEILVKFTHFGLLDFFKSFLSILHIFCLFSWFFFFKLVIFEASGGQFYILNGFRGSAQKLEPSYLLHLKNIISINNYLIEGSCSSSKKVDFFFKKQYKKAECSQAEK